MHREMSYLMRLNYPFMDHWKKYLAPYAIIGIATLGVICYGRPGEINLDTLLPLVSMGSLFTAALGTPIAMIVDDIIRSGYCKDAQRKAFGEVRLKMQEAFLQSPTY